MKQLKKIWIFLVAMMPISAGAIAPVVLGGLIAGVGIIGISIWRSNVPVDMQSAFNFFSSCWTCQLFSDIMHAMSNLLPTVYDALGHVMIPFSIALLAIFIAWRLASGMINGKMEGASKIFGNLGSYTVKLTVLLSLLLMPLPRLITSVLLEPALTVGTTMDYVLSENNKFSACMIATAIADPTSASPETAKSGAFSPKLRHQLSCEIANIHQLTGLGMTVGWTLMGMAFDRDYMHKIFTRPIFPNVVMFFGGLLVLGLFFYALLPIPLYFLEIFIKLSMDLIMLPLMLMAWMFDSDDFALFPKGGQTIRQMIDDVINGVVGIALTVVFLTFSVMFLNAAFGSWTGSDLLQQAMINNDSKFLIDGLMMQNNSFITVVLMGIFLAMFMTMIPQLTSMLFKIKISDKYYESAKNDLSTLWKDIKKMGDVIKK